MAILDVVPGFEVSVRVNGEPLKEYDDDEDVVAEKPGAIGEYQKARTICKYIEAMSNTEFTVHLTVGTSFNMDSPGLSTPIFIDGKCANEPGFFKQNYTASIQGNRILVPLVRIVEGVNSTAPGKIDQQFLKPFKFSHIDTTSDDAKLNDVKTDTEALARVGEIKVKVYRCNEGQVVKDCAVPLVRSSSIETKVHEKALKGDPKSHSVSFGPATKLVAKNYFRTDRLDGDDYPIAIFKFKYRSRNALKSLLIIERTPSPDPESVSGSPSPPPVDLNNLDPAQKRQLARLLNDMNRGRSSSSTPQRTIKRERDSGEGPSNSRKKKQLGKKVTIDLTADSDEENIISLN